MAIFYLPELKQHAKEILLNEEESKHCVRVLRAKEGDNLTLVNGKGLSAQAIIIDANPKKCKAQPKEFTIHPATKDIHVAVCPTKNADRMEWFIEKAVELGLTKVTFLMAKNNERNLINIERLEKIAISAMKQSKRYYLPEILPMTRIDTFTANFPSGYIAHCHEEGDKHPVLQTLTNAPIMIGPEGDFTRDEVELAKKNGYVSLDFGSFRLRTETAALAAVFYLLK